MSQSVVTPLARMASAISSSEGRGTGTIASFPPLKRAPKFECRRVEREWGEVENHLLRSEIGEIAVRHQAEDAAMRDHDPLGRPVDPEVYIT